MYLFYLFILLLPLCTNAVDRGKFKTCEQSGFCKRHRDHAKTTSDPYTVDSTSVQANDSSINAVLENKQNKLKLTVALLEDSRVRLFIDEAGEKLHQRFHATESAFFLSKKDGHKIVINYKPFRVDVYSKNDLIISVNSQSLLKFEHFREKTEGESNDDGFWEETYNGITDTKPYGSSSIGLDVSFIGSKFVYGLPEHGDSFALKSTM